MPQLDTNSLTAQFMNPTLYYWFFLWLSVTLLFPQYILINLTLLRYWLILYSGIVKYKLSSFLSQFFVLIMFYINQTAIKLCVVDYIINIRTYLKSFHYNYYAFLHLKEFNEKGVLINKTVKTSSKTSSKRFLTSVNCFRTSTNFFLSKGFDFNFSTKVSNPLRLLYVSKIFTIKISRYKSFYKKPLKLRVGFSLNKFCKRKNKRYFWPLLKKITTKTNSQTKLLLCSKVSTQLNSIISKKEQNLIMPAFVEEIFFFKIFNIVSNK